MFPLSSGGAAPYRSEVSTSTFVHRPYGSDSPSDVADLRRQYAQAPRDSPLRGQLFSMATGASGSVAAFLDPLLPRDARGGCLLNAQELAALRCVVFLPAEEVGLDALLRAGLPTDAAHDLCGLLRDAPEDAVMTTLASMAATPLPLAHWWSQAPALTGGVASRNARRSLRVLQLAGHRQWPFAENVWRGAVTLAGQALQCRTASRLPADPDMGLALLDFLPRNPHSQRLMTTFTGEPILLYSMRTGFPVAAVEKMLALGFDVNVASPEGRAPAGDAVPILSGGTPLHYAALHGDLEMIGLLASSGADLNARDTRGYSPILYARAGAAALYGHDAATTFRRQARTDIRLRDATAAVVCSLHGLGADPRVRGYDGGGLGLTLIHSVIASRDGGGMDQWPEFEQLIVRLNDLGVSFEAHAGIGAEHVAAFAQVNAHDNPNDAIWALGALLSKLQAW